MSKLIKVLIIAVIVLIVGFGGLVFRPSFSSYISGDIGVGEVLQYPLLKSEMLCNIVGGEIKKEVQGWSDGIVRYCLVKDMEKCEKHGGEIRSIDNKVGALKNFFVGIDGGCYRIK